MNDDSDDVHGEWRPSSKQFDQYLTDEEYLAQFNLTLILQDAGRPLSLREMKDVCLHSSTTVESVVRSGVKSRVFSEQRQGKMMVYSLA